ncbi:MAG TPA: HAMP domain-containing sensor histidine kinase [Longimicrobiales bacterium]
MIPSVERLRYRLTLWYVTVFTVIMAAFGVAAYVVLTREMELGLDRSLERTVDIRTRWVLEGTRPRSSRFNPEDSIPLERQVFVFSANRRKGCANCPPFWFIEPIAPKKAASFIQSHALRVLNDSTPKYRVRLSDGTRYILYGKKVTAQSGRVYATVAVAASEELQRRYPSAFMGFIGAAVVALLLVGIGGATLAQESIKPIESAITQMRRFMGDAAHELKTPIAVLRARTDVALQRERSTEEYHEILTSVSSEAERLGNLVENMLLLARADSGQWPVQKTKVYLDDVLMDAASAARALGSHKNVQIELDTLEEAAINGDPTLLRQLLMILLDNAINFTPEGGKVSALAEKNGRSCRVTIKDTGVGIPTSALPHVFERFFRADPARSRGGTGLGLSIARWIVDVHHGRIDVQSAEGKGTTVSVTFPSARPSGSRSSA